MYNCMWNPPDNVQLHVQSTQLGNATTTRRSLEWAGHNQTQAPSTGLRHWSFVITTAIFDYAIGLEKLSANEQVFDDAQKAVSL